MLKKLGVSNEWKKLNLFFLQDGFSEDGANTISIQLGEEEALHDEEDDLHQC